MKYSLTPYHAAEQSLYLGFALAFAFTDDQARALCVAQSNRQRVRCIEGFGQFREGEHLANHILNLLFGSLTIACYCLLDSRRCIVGDGQTGLAHRDNQPAPGLIQLGRHSGIFTDEGVFNSPLFRGVFAYQPRHLVENMDQPVLELALLGANTTAGDQSDLAFAIFDKPIPRAPAARVYSENDQGRRTIRLLPLVFLARLPVGQNWSTLFARHPSPQVLRASG